MARSKGLPARQSSTLPDRPFVPGFALSILAPFGLFGRPLSLAAISVAPSPHPKIPFLADKAWRTALRGWGAICLPSARL